MNIFFAPFVIFLVQIVQVSVTDPTLPIRYDPALPVTNVTINCASTIQSCIDAAIPGTTILLPAGAIFEPTPALSIMLRKKYNPNNQWIVIRSADSAFDTLGTIKPGTRLNGNSSEHRAKLARLRSLPVAASGTPVIRAEAGASHYWMIGLEVAPAATITDMTTLVDLGSGTIYEDEYPHNIVIDRCYVHGLDRGATDAEKKYRNGIRMDGKFLAVINSHIDNFHSANPSDSQAIYGFHGMGPLRISNNLLEGASENIMFGGGCTDPKIRNRSTGAILEVSPSDIVIDRNYLTKRDAWRIAGQGIKNLFELKNAKRVLLEGNQFENSWLGEVGQMHAVLLKSSNDLGECPWCGTEHVTIRNNSFKTISGAMSILGYQSNPCGVPHNVVARPVGWVKIENNLFDDVRPPYAPHWPSNPYFVNPAWWGIGDFLQLVGTSSPGLRIHDLQLVHNTGQGAYRMMYFVCSGTGACVENMSVRDSIFERGAYGVFRSSAANEGAVEFDNSVTGIKEWKRNLVVNNSEYSDQYRTDTGLAALYPSGCSTPNSACDPTRQTLIASNWEGVGFTNRIAGDYRLAPTSPFKALASDSTDIGADIARIELAQAGSGYNSGSGSGGNSASFSNVTWVNPTLGAGVSQNGAVISKVDFCGTCPAGARSQQEWAGDGWIEFVIDGRNTTRFFGLTNADSAPNGSQIDFAFKVTGLFGLEVREDDRLVAFQPVAIGDRVRIVIENQAVKYSKNGVSFFSSARIPTFPLHAEASLTAVGDSLSNVTYFAPFAPVAPINAPISVPVTWSNPSWGAAISGTKIRKTDFCNGCPQGARSVQELTGNGYVEFTTNASTSIRYFGLTNVAAVPNYALIDHAFKFWGMGGIDAREDDRYFGLGALGGPVAVGEKFRIEIRNGKATLLRNGIIVHASVKPVVFPVHIEVVLFEVGSEIDNIVLYQTP